MVAPTQVVVEVANGEEFLALSEGTDCVLGPPRMSLTSLLVSQEIFFLQLCGAAWPGAGPDPVASLDDGLQVPVPARRIVEDAPGLRALLDSET